MAETEETPQIDDTRLQAIRRRIEEVVGDAPQLAKLALEQMVTKHNPDLKGTAGSAGRVGAQSGNVSELTAIANLKPCLLYTSPSPRDLSTSRMPSSA